MTRPNRLPWVVGVYEVNTKGIFLCSGALISNKHVISSAQCAYTLRMHRRNYGYQLEIRLGQVNTVKRGISRIHDHDDWNSANMDFKEHAWER